MHMRSDFVRVCGAPCYEGLVDTILCVTCAAVSGKLPVYLVKPKLHGPEEVEFTCRLLSQLEQDLEIPQFSVKLGLMDEERRFSANLASCIYAASDRVFFVNTGFLDRTGSEIHSAMQLGPVPSRTDLKRLAWFEAYEKRNVQIALDCGFRGVAQIGKGMWPEPDNLQGLLKIKISQPLAGASTAWVPSPSGGPNWRSIS